MKILLAIGSGSFIGGVSRYLLSQLVQGRSGSSFPYGTLSVNMLGCFLIGVVFALSDRGNLSQEWRLFLATGILGGFTTFSAFSNESLAMIRDGQITYSIFYISGSVILGLIATFIGIMLIKML
jgi:fluoride exporter